MQEAGSLLVKLLEKQNVDRVYCVPGESYLSVMNGLQETSIQTILCKHEGAASMMAEADGIYLNTNEHLRANNEVQTREDRFIKKVKIPLYLF